MTPKIGFDPEQEDDEPTNGTCRELEMYQVGVMSTVVATKVKAIMADSGYMVKEGKNKAQNYKYLSEEQIVFKLRELMIKHGLVAIPSVENVSLTDVARIGDKPPFIMATLAMRFRLTDIDTGEFEDMSMVGCGIDTGDKGIYKAMAGCNKYFLMKLFQIPSGNDPEKEFSEEIDDLPFETADPVVKKVADLAKEPAHDEPKKSPIEKPKPIDSRTKAFYAKVDELMKEARDNYPDGVVDKVYNIMLGNHGVEKKEEITNGKARLAFVKGLEPALNELGGE